MSLGVEIPRATYTGNGETTIFPYNFTLSNESDVQVFIDGEEIKTGFDLGDSQVTFHNAPDSSVEIDILRNTPFDQDASFSDPSNTTLEELERAFDRITRHSQELRLKANDNAEELEKSLEVITDLEGRLSELASLRSQSITTSEGVIERATATFRLPFSVVNYALPSSPGGRFSPEDIVSFRITRISGGFLLEREDFDAFGNLLFKAPIPEGNIFDIIISYEKQS